MTLRLSDRRRRVLEPYPADAMRITYRKNDAWPPLAWLATCSPTSVEVVHGGRMECTPEWFCEAAWDGPFEDGGFDVTDIIAGSGGRKRGDRIIFVSASSTVDRLQWYRDGARAWISNSLPCLLAATGLRPDPLYPHYHSDFFTIVYGLTRYTRRLRTTTRPVELTYFDNVVWDGSELTVEPKPMPRRDLSSFSSYVQMLDGAMQRIIDNATCRARSCPYGLLGTISAGYDSATVSALASRHGLRDVLTFDFKDDSGAETAQYLGLRTHCLAREAWLQAPGCEIPFIASDAFGEDVHFSAAEALLGGRLFFTGYHGDKVWGLDVEHLEPTIERGDLSGSSFTEYRLRCSFLHCPVPFWAVRDIRSIHTISHSPEMLPWDTPYRGYSRPICRRIVEEAGVPRSCFGQRKRATAAWLHADLDFLTPSSQRQYLEWLCVHGGGLVSPRITRGADRLTIAVAKKGERLASHVRQLIGAQSMRALRAADALGLNRVATVTWANTGRPPWIPPLRRRVFAWATERAMSVYK